MENKKLTTFEKAEIVVYSAATAIGVTAGVVCAGENNILAVGGVLVAAGSAIKIAPKLKKIAINCFNRSKEK